MYLSLLILLGMKHKNIHSVVNNDFTKEEKYTLKSMEREAIAS
jgi:hypothetical protein